MAFGIGNNVPVEPVHTSPLCISELIHKRTVTASALWSESQLPVPEPEAMPEPCSLKYRVTSLAGELFNMEHLVDSKSVICSRQSDQRELIECSLAFYIKRQMHLPYVIM